MNSILTCSHIFVIFRFSKMGFLGNYIESQWALANFTVPPECACICAFASHSSVVGKTIKYFLFINKVVFRILVESVFLNSNLYGRNLSQIRF